MGTALLVIDMQVGLVPLVWRGEELVDRIAKLVAAAHARDVPVIAVQQTGPPLTAETPDWQLVPRLGVLDTDPRIQKQATDSFYRSDLADLLAARAVDTVVITGLATDYCVDATARSALSHGLNVILVSDGHTPAAPTGLTPQQVIDHHNTILSNAIHPGGHLRLMPAAEVSAGIWTSSAYGTISPAAR
jgi:nicotinamidase-related amidase